MTRAFQKPLGVLAYYFSGKFGKDRISVIPVLFFSFNSIKLNVYIIFLIAITCNRYKTTV